MSGGQPARAGETHAAGCNGPVRTPDDRVECDCGLVNRPAMVRTFIRKSHPTPEDAPR